MVEKSYGIEGVNELSPGEMCKLLCIVTRKTMRYLDDIFNVTEHNTFYQAYEQVFLHMLASYGENELSKINQYDLEIDRVMLHLPSSDRVMSRTLDWLIQSDIHPHNLINLMQIVFDAYINMVKPTYTSLNVLVQEAQSRYKDSIKSFKAGVSAHLCTMKRNQKVHFVQLALSVTSR